MANTITETTREKLVANILYYSGDEFESPQDMVELAKESDDELLDRLIGILDYYYDLYDQAQNN